MNGDLAGWVSTYIDLAAILCFLAVALIAIGFMVASWLNAHARFATQDVRFPHKMD